MPIPYSDCPQCGHKPLPAEQSLPAACPRCGVILAKVGQGLRPIARGGQVTAELQTDSGGVAALLTQVPERFDALHFWSRLALWAGLVLWGWVLVGMDYRTGEMGESFIHRP